MHEVGGAYCDCFDPDAPEGIIAIVKKYMEDPLSYQKQRERLSAYVPFTWNEMAGRTLTILLEEKKNEA